MYGGGYVFLGKPKLFQYGALLLRYRVVEQHAAFRLDRLYHPQLVERLCLCGRRTSICLSRSR